MIENAWQCLICFVLETPLGPGGGDRRQTWQTMPVARPFSTYLMAMREEVIWLLENWWSWSQFRQELLWLYSSLSRLVFRAWIWVSQASRASIGVSQAFRAAIWVSQTSRAGIWASQVSRAGIWVSQASRAQRYSRLSVWNLSISSLSGWNFRYPSL